MKILNKLLTQQEIDLLPIRFKKKLGHVFIVNKKHFLLSIDELENLDFNPDFIDESSLDNFYKITKNFIKY